MPVITGRAGGGGSAAARRSASRRASSARSASDSRANRLLAPSLRADRIAADTSSPRAVRATSVARRSAGSGAPLDEPALSQCVDHFRGRARRDPQVLGQLAQPLRPAPTQHGQRPGLRRRDVPFGQRLLRHGPQPAAQRPERLDERLVRSVHADTLPHCEVTSSLTTVERSPFGAPPQYPHRHPRREGPSPQRVACAASAASSSPTGAPSRASPRSSSPRPCSAWPRRSCSAP